MGSGSFKKDKKLTMSGVIFYQKNYKEHFSRINMKWIMYCNTKSKKRHFILHKNHKKLEKWLRSGRKWQQSYKWIRIEFISIRKKNNGMRSTITNEYILYLRTKDLQKKKREIFIKNFKLKKSFKNSWNEWGRDYNERFLLSIEKSCLIFNFLLRL